MIVLTKDEVLRLHEKIINKTGGLHGLRDTGMLESAIMNCMQTFDDEELYPTVIEKAAITAFSLCKDHPFIDGNKRIAVLVMLTELRINRVKLSFTQRELIDLGIGIADGSVSYEDIVTWIKDKRL